uniref:Uncharacterized protein n=1 Tax=Arundo donax TaxID=35708 RepID=A0A0A9AWS2_ARUDO
MQPLSSSNYPVYNQNMVTGMVVPEVGLIKILKHLEH